MENKFTELLYQNQGIVSKICNLYFNNRTDIEDYRQELIIQLWKAFPQFNFKSKFSTWMYRVCLNAAIDIIRKEKRQPQFIKLESQHTNNLFYQTSEPSSQQEKLYKAISNLSAIDKAIISLYLDEFSYKEIADIIGISENNTGAKINRIKSLIIKSIENGNK